MIYLFALTGLGDVGAAIFIVQVLLAMGLILLTAAVGAYFRSSLAASVSYWTANLLGLFLFGVVCASWAGLPPPTSQSEAEVALKLDPDWEDPRDYAWRERVGWDALLILWLVPMGAASLSYRIASSPPTSRPVIK